MWGCRDSDYGYIACYREGVFLFFFFYFIVVFFFFKQKTAYEIYQCDWSSDVCSSDLEKLKVEFTVEKHKFKSVSLTGPAKKIFTGKITI